MSICSYSSLQTPNLRSYVETLTEPEIAVTVEDEQVSCTALTEFPGVRTAKNGCVEHYFVKRLSDRQGQGGDCKWKGTLPNGATNALKKGINSAKACANFCLRSDSDNIGVAGFELDCTASTCYW